MSVYSFISRLYRHFQEEKRRRYISGLIENGMKIGNGVEIIDTFFFDPSHCCLISIGDHCTICPNVRLIAHDASTKKILGYTKIGRIDIKESCFLGDSVIVLPGVTVGPNSIVGAGSVVTKDIPPDMVAAGNPARLICRVDEYISKIRTLAGVKRIFDEQYFIENLDEKKRNEMLDSVSDGLGFIV